MIFGLALWGLGVCPPSRAAEGGPDLAFTGLTPEDGLSQNSVFAIAEDSQGFLWLGTEDGLNRWDGRHFEVYRSGRRDDPVALHGRFVRAIVEDAAGRLWIGTEGGGLGRFDPRTETFFNFHHRTGDTSSLAEDLVLTMVLDGAGDLWIGTRNRGLDRLRQIAQVGHQAGFEHFPGTGAPCELGSAKITSLSVDSTGRLWVATDDGLYLRQPSDGCFEPFANASTGLVDPRLTHVATDRRSRLWVSTRSGLYRLNSETGEAAATYLSGQVVLATLEDRDGELWVATESKGLVRLDPATDRKASYTSRAFDSESLATDVVRVLHEDRAGTLWIGLEQGGVAYAPRLRRHIARWRSLRTRNGLEQLKSVFALHSDQHDQVWIGTRDRGLFALDQTTGNALHWGAGDGKPDALDSSRISALAASGDGGILVGTVEGGVYRIEPSSRRMVRLPISGTRSIRSLVPDPAGGVWVATWGDGLLHLAGDGRIESFKHDPLDPASLSDNVVLCLEPETTVDDTFDALWAGTWSGGLVRLDLISGEARAYRHSAANPNSLASDQVASVRRDRRGRIWVGTAEGLDLLSENGNSFEPVQAFVGTVVFGLLEDREGHLWASTDRGLWHYDIDTDQAWQIRARHGLQGDEYNLGAVATGRSGELLFGGVSGFDILRPHRGSFEEQRDPFAGERAPPIVLTQLATGQRTLGAGQLRNRVQLGESVELDFDERSFSLSFAALHFADVQHQRFAYRLGGSDAEWVDAGRQREARFTHLPPGRHTLQVIGASGTGVWNREGVELDVYVRPTFSEQRLVRGAGAIIGLGLLAAIVNAGSRRRLRKLETEREEAIEVRHRLLAAREEERLRLAQELHDGPLQALHAMQLAVSRGPRDLTGLRQDLGVLVQELREVCTRLRSPVLQLFGLEEAIRDHTEERFLQKSGIDLELDLRLGTPAAGDDLPPDLRLALFRVFSEALNNAARHGRPQRVRVTLDRVDATVGRPGDRDSRSAMDDVRLTISDDGCGFTVHDRWVEAARKGHLGILGMAERIDAVGGRLDVFSAPGKGTRVVAVVPSPTTQDVANDRLEEESDG